MVIKHISIINADQQTFCQLKQCDCLSSFCIYELMLAKFISTKIEDPVTAILKVQCYWGSHLFWTLFQPLLGTAAVTLPVPLTEEWMGELVPTPAYVKSTTWHLSLYVPPKRNCWIDNGNMDLTFSYRAARFTKGWMVRWGDGKTRKPYLHNWGYFASPFKMVTFWFTSTTKHKLWSSYSKYSIEKVVYILLV